MLGLANTSKNKRKLLSEKVHQKMIYICIYTHTHTYTQWNTVHHKEYEMLFIQQHIGLENY